MTRSGPTEREGEYRIRGTQTATSTSHCMAIYSRPLFSRRYRIEAKFRHDEGKVVNGLEYSHMGLLVKYENKENFVYAIVRYSPTVQPIQGILGWGGGGGGLRMMGILILPPLENAGKQCFLACQPSGNIVR